MAKTGINLKQHYSGAPVCAPSRCALLTGKHMGHAYIRGNDEWGERGDVWSLKAMNENPKLEGQRPMPDSIITIAEVLKSKGYTTALIGKWGLGAPYTESIPNKQGFDFSSDIIVNARLIPCILPIFGRMKKSFPFVIGL